MHKPSPTKPVNRRTVIKGTAVTLAVAVTGIPVLANAQLPPVAKALEFIRQADRLGFRYSVNGFGYVCFDQGSNESCGPNWSKGCNWPELDKLREEVLPRNLPMQEALSELDRVEPPYVPPDMSNCRWVAL